MIQPRILATVSQDNFCGREAELRDIERHASGADGSRSLVLMATADAGAPELLRQAYDRLFRRRGDPVPVYFAFQRSDTTAANTARRFFQSVLQQYTAYRRVNPSLSKATLTFNDLLELALPGDYELTTNLIEAFHREQSSETDFISFCLGLPERLRAAGRAVFPLIDCTSVGPFRGDLTVAQRVASQLANSESTFVLAGLRRQMNELIHGAENGGWDPGSIIHLDHLSDGAAAQLLESMARQHQIDANEATRDLIIQQLNASPFFMTEFIRAAHRTGSRLNSFLACQRLYVDELLGGVPKRYFDRMLEMIAPNRQTNRTLLRILYESAMSETRKASLWTWKKRLGLGSPEFEQVIDALHVYELVNSSAAFIEVNPESYVWLDYLRAHYRVEVTGEARATVVGSTLLETLERAPQTMSRKYRREAAVGLRDLLPQFDCQRVPASLLHYDRFAVYKGEESEAIEDGLEAESDLVQLPQVIQTAACSSYANGVNCEPERCIVAHAFAAADYTEESEVVWLAAEIDSKLEAGREVTEEWCNRLATFARESGFDRFRIWLIAPEGFSESASELLKEREAFGSSRQQVKLLAARMQSEIRPAELKPDEYEMVIPMGGDTELIAANTVERIARRVKFQPEAINQIKTALVEACINAAEHSLSPDRKIYQRFVVGDDKLVVTVASRGVLPAEVTGQNGQDAGSEENGGRSRRGWGLKLIRTLMDEVEFERVDDGTQLRMTKYVR